MSTESREPGQPATADAEQPGGAAPDLQDDLLAPADALAGLVPPGLVTEPAPVVTMAVAAAPDVDSVTDEAAVVEHTAAAAAVVEPAVAEAVEEAELVPLELPRELVEVEAAPRSADEPAVQARSTDVDESALPPVASVDRVLGMDAIETDDGEPGTAGKGQPAVDVEPLPDLLPILEALLFASDRPVSVQALSATLRVEHPSLRAPAVRVALRQLQQAYADDSRRCGRGFTLSEVAGGYVLRSTPAFAPYLQRFTSQKPQRLSRAALETLAVVAYRQPVTRPQVDEVRGVESSSAVKYLLDKCLIRVLGKSEEVGRPLLYGTTPEFLELFSLRSLSHLPTLQEYQELDPDSQAKVDALPGTEPVRVTDLASVDGRIVSPTTEEDSAGALSDLESAVAEADQRRRESDHSLAPASVEGAASAAGEARDAGTAEQASAVDDALADEALQEPAAADEPEPTLAPDELDEPTAGEGGEHAD